MKIYIPFIFLLSILFSSCDDAITSFDLKSTTLLTNLSNTKWRLENFVDSSGNISKMETKYLNRFKLHFKNDSTIDFNSGCNSGYAKYNFSPSKTFILAGLSTKVYCLFTDEFESFISKTYQIKASNDELILKINSKECYEMYFTRIAE